MCLTVATQLRFYSATVCIYKLAKAPRPRTALWWHICMFKSPHKAFGHGRKTLKVDWANLWSMIVKWANQKSRTIFTKDRLGKYVSVHLAAATCRLNVTGWILSNRVAVQGQRRAAAAPLSHKHRGTEGAQRDTNGFANNASIDSV